MNSTTSIMLLLHFALLSAASTALAASWIVPGAVWTSTSGTKIDAHGGNVVKRGDTFYWVGQSASHGKPQGLYPFLLYSRRMLADDAFVVPGRKQSLHVLIQRSSHLDT